MLPHLFFLGTGNMGQPMAANLIRAGYDVTVYDRIISKTEKLINMGAHFASDVATAAQSADIIITSLPGPPEVSAVMLGDQGLIAQARKNTIIIDTSTSAADLVGDLVAHAAQRGVHFLEAPVTNAIDMAELGRLSIFVGGDEDIYQQCKPLFEVIGENIFYVGKAGNGATIKLLTNLLWFVSAATIGEALMLGAKAGVPLDIVWQAIKASAGSSWVAEHDVPSIFAGHYDPSFTLDLCCKDLRLVNDIAAAQNFELSMGRFVQGLFEQARAKYGGDAAELHVVKLLEERAGLLLRPPHGVPVQNAETSS
jgi:3-hydroxyisobutyrate dehydrogenase-like beta-hydroxyacid dehydrogenase